MEKQQEMLIHNSIKEVVNKLIVSSSMNICLLGNKGMGKAHIAYEIAAAKLNVPVESLATANEFIQIILEGQPITVDMLKKAVERTMYYADKKYVLFIDDANCMDEYVQNKLLKLLEDSSDRITVLLVCHERLLDTIFSRCAVIEFPKFGNSELRGYFKNVNEVALMGSDGTPGNYLRIVSDEAFLAQIETFFNDFVQINKRENLHAVFEMACCYKENDSNSFSTRFEAWQKVVFFTIFAEIFLRVSYEKLNVSTGNEGLSVKNISAFYSLEESLYLMRESIHLSRICHDTRKFNKNDFIEYLMHIVDPDIFMEVKNKYDIC